MRQRALAAIIAILFLGSSVTFASQAPAPSVTGKWSGSFKVMKDGKVVEDETAYMVLKQEKGVVTGTAGPSTAEQLPIAKGKIVTARNVTSITFEVQTDALIQFDLKLVNGRLKGNATGVDGGQKILAVLDLGPVK